MAVVTTPQLFQLYEQAPWRTLNSRCASRSCAGTLHRALRSRASATAEIACPAPKGTLVPPADPIPLKQPCPGLVGCSVVSDSLPIHGLNPIVFSVHGILQAGILE